MTKRIKFEMTRAEVQAIVNIVDECSAMLGGGDNDEERVKWVKRFDKMFARHGFKRMYN